MWKSGLWIFVAHLPSSLFGVIDRQCPALGHCTFCSLQLELNPTIVCFNMFYLLLSHRSCKTICHNPSAASLCCVWNDSSIRCLHFIDHNIALCWIPGNILQPFPLFSSPYGRKVGLLMTADFSNYWAPGRCIPIWWCVRTSGMYPQLDHDMILRRWWVTSGCQWMPVDGMGYPISSSHPKNEIPCCWLYLYISHYTPVYHHKMVGFPPVGRKSPGWVWLRSTSIAKAWYDWPPKSTSALQIARRLLGGR